MADIIAMPGGMPVKESGNAQPKTKFGAGFWILLTLTILHDIFALACLITVYLAWIPPITSFIMNGIVGIYLYVFVGISLNSRKMVSYGASFIIGEMVPTSTINLVLARFIDILDERVLKKVASVVPLK